MLVFIILGTFICIGFGVCFYFLASIRKALIKNKIKLSQNNTAIKYVQEQLKQHETKLDTIINLLHDLEMKSSLSVKNKDSIEHQYDRAKRILKNNVLQEDALLQSCDMTAEEIELLSGLIQNNE